MISVVIPAHNEATVIERLLLGITTDATPGELEITIGCNGCTDDTAKVCREFDFPINVCETDEASKIAGLNLGDDAATEFPRFYIDADVQVTHATLVRVANVMNGGDILAAAPQMRVDLSRSSFVVKAFYNVWLRLPYHRDGMVGSGFYGVSEQGRKRFGRFPKIIADDGFFRAQFSSTERITLTDCSFTIVAPTNAWDLIKVKTRSRLGLWELGRRFPETKPRERKDWRSAPKELLRTPSLWLSVPIYLAIVLITKFRAKGKLSSLESYKWERDDSSR